ncbi:glycosyltransferase family 9 protein [Flavitalea antarctica]
MQQILIIQTAFIGDVVLATGLIEKLHRYFPEAKIDFLLRKGNEGLLLGHPYLREVLIWDKKSNKNINLYKLLKKIRKTGYDKIINVQRFAATGMLTAFSGAAEKIGFDKNPLSVFFTQKVGHVIGSEDKIHHEIDRNVRLISSFTDDVPEKPVLYPTSADENRVAQYKLRPYITVSPSSIWFTKQYPVDKWVSFIDQVPPQYNIYLLGAPSDQERGEKIIAKSTQGSVINLCGHLNFLQSAALMRDALMNYVNDSAPMHFASAVNAPVTAVYCSTLPSFGFGPLSDNSHIVEVPYPLACRPCGLHGRDACPLGHFKCAFDIKDEQLLQHVFG